MSQSLFAPFQPLAAIATTPGAVEILAFVCQVTGATLHLSDSLPPTNNSKIYKGTLKEHLEAIWEENRGFIFCLAAGAVVRLIGPLLQDKSQDPAIIVIDQGGRYVISLCSGHQGGAEHLAELIAHQIGATPIITGASANLGINAIDLLGIPFGWRKGGGDWNQVSALLARGETIQVIQEVGTTLWIPHLPSNHSFSFAPSPESVTPKGKVWISARQIELSSNSTMPQVQWYPRVFWVGIGCIRGTSGKLIDTAIHTVFQSYHLALQAIAGIATIELKGDEVGLVTYCQEKQLPLKTFPPEILGAQEVPTPSPLVEKEVGTPSVAEAAALCAAPGGKLIVPKQIIKAEDEFGAVTVAIAQGELEFTGRVGKLYLVGIGPGSLEQITPAAKTAIAQADVIIGYGLYLDLIKPLQRPGQIRESFPITQEKQRANRAIELAQWGLTVAVVSSGDCGIYGMGGLVLEQLKETGWDGKTPQVEVFPGISALQAAAARVGAPLMHDFCAISLSDLLTPWDVIEKRLLAAAKADFVTAIYNPRSVKRTEQIVIAQKIFLQYRHPDNPVAIVHSAYRQDEKIVLTTLDKFLDYPLDMLTTIIIGNSSTYNYSSWMITPRGYNASSPIQKH